MPESHQPFPAAELRHHPGRGGPGRRARRRAAYLAGPRGSQTLPPGYNIDYGGPSRQYVQEAAALSSPSRLPLIIIFLALAALFNSFRDPLIILVSVPMSIAGALIFICLGFGGATLNIYTEVGLVTLMGLVSKHGILIVEVANEAQQAGQVASATRSKTPPASGCARS